MYKNIGLVMEGGGFRGCYTAGALQWLLDNNIHIPYSVAISAASAYAFFYETNRPEQMHDISTKGVKDKEVVGITPIFKEGTIVGFNHLLNNFLKPYYADALKDLKNSDNDVEIGVYNMTKQQLEYYNKDGFDPEGNLFKACCTLPISGKMVTVNGNQFLDGGIRTMVSIERSVSTGHDKNLVIVTKDKNYVRKPNGFFLANLLRLVYCKYKTMLATLDDRVDNYYHEMDMVYKAEEEGKALLIRPTRDCGVGRFSGSEEQLEEMYRLGYQDMEDQKERIFKFLEIEPENK